MVVTKDYRIIGPKRNSTIAKLSGIWQDQSNRFNLYLLEIKKIRACRTWSILKIIRPEASNVIHML